GDGVWDEIAIDPIPALASIQDRVAKGFELELVASPTSNWHIVGNISQQETLQSNTASVMSALLEEYNGNLQSARLGEMSRDGSGTVQTRSVNEIWLADQMGSMRTAKAVDGTVSNEQREWHYTGVSTYDFTEGALKGAAIGGALRWESKAATGYLLTLEPESGAPIPDVTNPLFAADFILAVSSYGGKESATKTYAETSTDLVGLGAWLDLAEIDSEVFYIVKAMFLENDHFRDDNSSSDTMATVSKLMRWEKVYSEN
ncbi:MAG: hypothetical protein ACJ07L_08515, partial [Opitutales bacterium]